MSKLNYIIKRILQMIPVILISAVLIWVMIRAIPGDPARIMVGEHALPEVYEAYREKMGLNEPYITQFIRYITSLVRLDLGESTHYQLPVTELLARRHRSRQRRGHARDAKGLEGADRGKAEAQHHARLDSHQQRADEHGNRQERNIDKAQGDHADGRKAQQQHERDKERREHKIAHLFMFHFSSSIQVRLGYLMQCG